MEKKHPGYEEYRYQIDEITHNPYHLISYLTAKYGEFTYEEVKEELKKLLQKQYKLETNSKTEITTETKTVTVGEKLGSVVTLYVVVNGLMEQLQVVLCRRQNIRWLFMQRIRLFH